MAPKVDTITTPLASVGIDIGKDLFHVVGFGTDGKIAFRWKIKRLSFADAFKKLPPCIVGMEACLSAHFVSRTLHALGHEPRIIPAKTASERLHRNKLAVALANKLARIAWSVLRNDKAFDTHIETAAAI